MVIKRVTHDSHWQRPKQSGIWLALFVGLYFYTENSVLLVNFPQIRKYDPKYFTLSVVRYSHSKITVSIVSWKYRLQTAENYINIWILTSILPSSRCGLTKTNVSDIARNWRFRYLKWWYHTWYSLFIAVKEKFDIWYHCSCNGFVNGRVLAKKRQDIVFFSSKMMTNRRKVVSATGMRWISIGFHKTHYMSDFPHLYAQHEAPSFMLCSCTSDNDENECSNIKLIVLQTNPWISRPNANLSVWQYQAP